MSEQLSLLDWKIPAEVLPFPSHRSHGATAMVARAIVGMETAKRTGRLNSLRAQTKKRMEPIIGADKADRFTDDLISMVKIHLAYCEGSALPSPKQNRPEAVILSLNGQRIERAPHGDGVGEASALGQGAKLLVGLGEAHTEYDAACARDPEWRAS